MLLPALHSALSALGTYSVYFIAIVIVHVMSAAATTRHMYTHKTSERACVVVSIFRFMPMCLVAKYIILLCINTGF